MFASPGSVPSAALSDSVVASQLRQGVRGLRFSEPELEQDFRRNHRQHARGSVRANLWLAIALMIIFLIIDQQVLQRVQTLPLIVIRLVALSSLLACSMVLSSTRPITQHYHRFVQWLAPLFGLCVVINEFIDQPFGVSFFPTIVLTVVGLYLLVGMLFLPALCAGLFVLAAYAFGAWQIELPVPELTYNVSVLIFTNVIGATASYLLERLHRTHFLEARLLADMVNRDGLTGIRNRRSFDEHLHTTWQQALRDETPLALMLIDIDHFKAYNDYYGHQAGDECLKQVASMLARVSRRPLDFTARYGGEEFAVVLYNAHREYVEELAGAIRTALGQLALSHAASLVASQLTVSIGAACVIPTANRSSAGLVQLADEALYQAKDKGRDCCVIKDKEYGGLITGSYRNDEDEFVRLVS
jgi:diguanylate cyclase (GGDEF)-like protein